MEFQNRLSLSRGVAERPLLLLPSDGGVRMILDDFPNRIIDNLRPFRRDVDVHGKVGLVDVKSVLTAFVVAAVLKYLPVNGVWMLAKQNGVVRGCKRVAWQTAAQVPAIGGKFANVAKSRHVDCPHFLIQFQEYITHRNHPQAFFFPKIGEALFEALHHRVHMRPRVCVALRIGRVVVLEPLGSVVE